MLFLFTIDPNIFTSNIDRSLEEDLDEIFKYWKKVGVLVILNPNQSESKLYKAIRSCSYPAIKQKWSSGLLQDKMRQISTELNYEDLWVKGSNDEIYSASVLKTSGTCDVSSHNGSSSSSMSVGNDIDNNFARRVSYAT